LKEEQQELERESQKKTRGEKRTGGAIQPLLKSKKKINRLSWGEGLLNLFFSNVCGRATGEGRLEPTVGALLDYKDKAQRISEKAYSRGKPVAIVSGFSSNLGVLG